MPREAKVQPLRAHVASNICRASLKGFALLLLAWMPLLAQSAPVQRFDVISIKPVSSMAENMSWGMEGDSFHATNVNLRFLLASAYEIRQDLVQGMPKWALDGHWDIQAKISDADEAVLKKVNAAQRRDMMQQLLVDGFKLQVHRETHVQPVLELIVAPGGVKMKRHEIPQDDPAPEAKGSMSMGNGQLDGTATPVKDIARALAEATERSVIDKTGLAGLWDLSLRWAPEGDQESKDATLYTAVQEQLGLKLESGKGPVEILAVDHMEDPRQTQQ